MRSRWIMLVVVTLTSVRASGATDVSSLPELPSEHLRQPLLDWLLCENQFKAGLYKSADGKEIILSNGLVRRHIRLTPNAATVALDCTITTQSLLRSVRPEAVVQLNGLAQIHIDRQRRAWGVVEEQPQLAGGINDLRGVDVPV